MAKKSDPADKLDHEINSETWTCLECGRSMVPPSRKCRFLPIADSVPVIADSL